MSDQSEPVRPSIEEMINLVGMDYALPNIQARQLLVYVLSLEARLNQLTQVSE